MPRPSPLPWALGLALAVAGGCDEQLQKLLTNASKRQAEREAKQAAEAERVAQGLGPSDPIAPEIARVLQVVRTSDYDFIVRKGKRGRGKDEHKRFNGVDFASMLENKTRYLGRGIVELDAWIDEIGSSAFFSGAEYAVRLPDGREMSFRTWLSEELAALPPEPEGVAAGAPPTTVATSTPPPATPRQPSSVTPPRAPGP
jgi:hypothetical protein